MCSLLNTVLKVKNRMVVSVPAVYPSAQAADWAQHTAAAQHHESIVQHIASLGKDGNSNFEVWFVLNLYHCRTMVKLKDCKSSHS